MAVTESQRDFLRQRLQALMDGSPAAVSKYATDLRGAKDDAVLLLTSLAALPTTDEKASIGDAKSLPGEPAPRDAGDERTIQLFSEQQLVDVAAEDLDQYVELIAQELHLDEMDEDELLALVESVDDLVDEAVVIASAGLSDALERELVKASDRLFSIKEAEGK